MKKRKLMKIMFYYLLFLGFISTSITFIQAHSESGSGILDTGSENGALTPLFLAFGIGMFILIVISAIWLLKQPQTDNDGDSYMDKVKLFGKNARLYILHIQGMSLTYGVRTVVFNIYLLFIFRDGATLFGTTFNNVLYVGVLLALGSVITGIMSPFNGIIVDKLGKKWSFIWGDFIGSLTILFVIFIQNPGFVAVMQVLRAGVMSIHGIAEGPFIYEQSSAKERVHLFSVSAGMSTLASMSGNLVGGVVPLGIAIIVFQSAIVGGVESIFVLQIALFISVLMWWLSLLPAFYMVEDPELRAKANQHSVSARLSFKNVTNWKTIWVFVLSSVFIGTGAGLFVNFFDIFFFVVYNASTAQIALIFGLGSLFVAGGNFLSPILAERYGKVNFIAWSRFLSIIFIILIPLSPILVFAGIFYLLRVILMVSNFPAESALAMETVTDEERTTMEALRQGGASLFAALGFVTGSYFMSIENYAVPFFAAAGLYFVATLIFYMYFRNGKDIELTNQIQLSQGAVAVTGD